MSGRESRIREVAELDLKFASRRWRFADERAEEILEHWRARKIAQPSLFDGRVLLMGSHEFAARADGATILRGEYFETDFKAFLAWRDFGFPDQTVCNGFSMAALESADGAYLLGEMADHTASAGAIYFAAGTPDRKDLFGDRVDLQASVLRELREETGLAPVDVVLAEGWTVVEAPPRIACLKRLRVAASAEELKTRIEAYLAGERQPELARMHIARSLGDIDEKRMPRFIVDFLRHAYGASHISVG
jgi:8-oxo-dGTP pyrophosphatase MutT (NUDIX family)